MSGNFWFNGWAALARIEIFAVAAFVLLIGLVRILGKRTIATKNPSDFAFTVAVGSVLANWVLQPPVSVVEGVAAVTTLLVLQFLTGWLDTRYESVRTLTEGVPTLLAYRGRLLHENMRREHVNDHEIENALRQHGLDSIDDTSAIVLEIDGSFSVLRNDEEPPPTLEDVSFSARLSPRHASH